MFCFAAYCHEDNFCNYWTYEENLNTGEHNCSLLATCEKKVVASVPVRTSSGGRDCLPEPSKRRKCLPGCPAARPFCHGRSVPYGFGRCRCMFHPCDASPYRTSAESCQELAFKAEEENCQRACFHNGPEKCQECLEENLPKQCNQLSGSACWHCSSPIFKEYEFCEVVHPNGIEVVKCVKRKQIIEGCDSCVCTMFCYWSPGSA